MAKTLKQIREGDRVMTYWPSEEGFPIWLFAPVVKVTRDNIFVCQYPRIAYNRETGMPSFRKGTTPRANHPNPITPVSDEALEWEKATLFHYALKRVMRMTEAVINAYANLTEHRDHHGMPARPLQTKVPCGDRSAQLWSDIVGEWRRHYVDWCAAIAEARDAAGKPAISSLMDDVELPIVQRWTTKAGITLTELARPLHPVGMGGADGMGFIRCGLPPIPESFHTHADAVERLCDDVLNALRKWPTTYRLDTPCPPQAPPPSPPSAPAWPPPYRS
jgi:hypothetical protein